MTTWPVVNEFVGHYTVFGPKGHVEAESEQKALELALKVAEPWWGDIEIGKPYQRLFDAKYYVKIEPKPNV